MVFLKYEPQQNKKSGLDPSAGSSHGIFFSLVSPFHVEELEDKVFLNCNSSITWLEGTMGKMFLKNTSLNLGRRILDPRGFYKCNVTHYNVKKPILQVYYRSMCLLNSLGWNKWGFWI